jgi:hypothetical protein
MIIIHYLIYFMDIKIDYKKRHLKVLRFEVNINVIVNNTYYNCYNEKLHCIHFPVHLSLI